MAKNKTHYNDVTWASWHLESSATWSIVKQIVQTKYNGNIKNTYGWPFVRGIRRWTDDQIILLKGQLCGKRLHLMPPLCFRADSRLGARQWETSLQSTAVSHWLGTKLESALCLNWKEYHYCFGGLVNPCDSNWSANKANTVERKCAAVLSLYIYIHVHIYIYVCIYINIYI